jgi:molybdopterin synthase sulfur carrier subunit
MLQMLYFAWVRERIGIDGETIAIPPGVDDVAGLLDALEARGSGYADALFERDRIRVAVDQAFVGPDAPVRDGAEVAIFPPVTGG